MSKQSLGYIGKALLVVIVLVFGYLGIRLPDVPMPDVVDESLAGATTYNTACYRDQGGAAFTCDSGGGFVVGPTGTFKFEGATDDAYETTLAVTDPTANRTITAPNVSGTMLLTNTPGVTVFGSNVVTGTLSINHGLTTPQTAFCTMGADPVNDQEDRCTVLLSGSTVTVKVWKEAASPTAGDSGVLVFWQVAGQP